MHVIPGGPDDRTLEINKVRHPRRRLLIVVTAILVVVLAVGGTSGYLLTRSHGSPGTAATSAGQTTGAETTSVAINQNIATSTSTLAPTSPSSSTPTAGSTSGSTNAVAQVQTALPGLLSEKGYDPSQLVVSDIQVSGNWAIATLTAGDQDAVVALENEGGSWTIHGGPGDELTSAEAASLPSDLRSQVPIYPRETSTSTLTTAGVPNLTLLVRVLNTAFGIDGTHLNYPSTVSVSVPQAWAGQVAAYGVAGVVILAPIGWTESDALVGADGSSRVTLHSTSSSAIQGKISFMQTSASVGDTWDESAQYFSWVREQWSEYDQTDPTPALRTGLKEIFKGQQLVTYSVSGGSEPGSGLEVNGVAHTNIVPGSSQLTEYPGFDQLEVMLPSKDHGLATVILRYYLAHENDYYVGT